MANRIVVRGMDHAIKVIDQISLWSGKAVAWLIIPMIAMLAGEVIVRYVYAPTTWALDVATMLYGVHYLMAAAMTLYLGKHIRTDFFYGNWLPRTQAWVDVVCYVLLFLPGMAMFVWLSWDFAAESWDLRERLMTTWRPPAYWYKSVIPLSASLLLLQGVSELLKSVKLLLTGIDIRHREPVGEII
ncbi:MAG: TRAP transporter small permease subunit [Betaproteobacteria bacterium]|nr:TRAP transporter small permease subunit [Betaproteobacteria bacterium]